MLCQVVRTAAVVVWGGLVWHVAVLLGHVEVGVLRSSLYDTSAVLCFLRCSLRTWLDACSVPCRCDFRCPPQIVRDTTNSSTERKNCSIRPTEQSTTAKQPNTQTASQTARAEQSRAKQANPHLGTGRRSRFLPHALPALARCIAV